jgi:flagellar motor switch protein FliN/FliY
MTMNSQQVIASFSEELATVIAALTEVSLTAQPTDEGPGAGYLVTLTAVGGGRGTLYLHLDRIGAESLIKSTQGADADPSATDVLNAIREIAGQASASVIERWRLEGVGLTVNSVAAAPSVPDQAAATLMRIGKEDELVDLRLALWGTLELSAGAGAATESTEPAQPAGPHLEVILDMELPLAVRFGRTEMTLKTLTALGPGAVIDLGRSPDDPVDVLVSNQVVARGEVVVVGGNYGVRITDVISPAERVRYMELAS